MKYKFTFYVQRTASCKVQGHQFILLKKKAKNYLKLTVAYN